MGGVGGFVTPAAVPGSVEPGLVPAIWDTKPMRQAFHFRPHGEEFGKGAPYFGSSAVAFISNIGAVGIGELGGVCVA